MAPFVYSTIRESLGCPIPMGGLFSSVAAEAFAAGGHACGDDDGETQAWPLSLTMRAGVKCQASIGPIAHW